MKQPVWEPSPGALVAWLNANREARPVDLWTFTLVGGATVLRYSGGSVPVPVQANTWALGPGITRSRVRQSVGTAVDDLTGRLIADASVLVNGTPILQAMAKGVFDNATVRLDRAFLDANLQNKGVVPVFYGRMGAIDVGASGADFEVRSHAELLDVMIPTEVYQPGCRNTLFDAQCGLAASAFTVSGSTSAAGDSTRRVVTSTSAAVTAKPAAWADMGVLTFTSGANVGVARTVRTHTLAAGVATITAAFGWPFAIEAGATFTLRAGCNKVKDGDCTVKFANVARFRGEPYVPAPETVI